MKGKVVIIGHSYLSRLSIIRSVATTGCEITVIATSSPRADFFPWRRPIDSFSKYVSHFYYCDRQNEEALLTLLKEKCVTPGQKTVVIPDGDDIVAMLDDHREELGAYFVFPYIGLEQSSMRFWMEKTNQKELASKVGLNVAQGRVIEIRDGSYSVPPDIRYPCFCKPLATMVGGKGGMRRCDKIEDLVDSLEYIVKNRNRTERVLVEDYKEIETEYALMGFSDGEHVIIPGILEFMIISESHKGIALQGRIVPVDKYESLIGGFKELVRRMGFVGVFDIDFYKSGGSYFFCEMNLRFGGSGYAYTKMGINLPALMVRYFEGEGIDVCKTAVDGNAVYVNERMCLDDFSLGVFSWSQYRSVLDNADIRFVPDGQDPRPGYYYRILECRRRVARGLKRMIRIAHS